MKFRCLDKNFYLMEELPAINLQWRRRYYEVGDFEAQLAEEDYNPDVKYVWNTQTNELAEIQKPQFKSEGQGNMIYLNGHFVEHWLSQGAVSHLVARNAANITTTLSSLCSQMIISSSGGGAGLSRIAIGTIKPTTQTDIFEEKSGIEFLELATKRLTPIEYSQRLRFDYNTKRFYYDIWQGVDRSVEGNVNCRIFSTKLGNISDVDYDKDTTDYKNFAIITIERKDDRTIDTSLNRIKSGEEKKAIGLYENDTQSETDQEAIDKAINKAGLELDKHIVNENITFTPDKDRFQYMVDYDLGDRVLVVVSTLGIAKSLRIVGVNETYKDNGNMEMKLEVGDIKPTTFRKGW